jgi:hypothetical protein
VDRSVKLKKKNVPDDFHLMSQSTFWNDLEISASIFPETMVSGSLRTLCFLLLWERKRKWEWTKTVQNKRNYFKIKLEESNAEIGGGHRKAGGTKKQKERKRFNILCCRMSCWQY